jgi:anaerobic selenocysteine-containing dehydrogenase
LNMISKPSAETLVRFIASSFGATSYDELANAPHGILRADLSSVIQPAGKDDGARLDVLPPDVAAELAEARTSERQSGFKYLMTCRRMLETMNGAYRDGERTRQRFPVNPAWMNPLDMEAEGLANGDAVTISSQHGTVVAYVSPDSTMRCGVVSLTHAWGAPFASADPDGTKGAFTGRLSSLNPHELEAINYMPIQSAVPINIIRHTRAADLSMQSVQ